MKKRMMSLFLSFILLLSMPFAAPLSLAEELPEAEPAAEWIAEETTAEAPADVPDDAQPELPAPEEETPPEEAAPQEELTEDAPPEAPEAEIPAEDAEIPTEDVEIPAEDIEAPAGEEIAEEEIDTSNYPALGTSGVQYAGVAYLSRAAFESMDEAGQKAYIEMVDNFDATMEEGLPLLNAVFSLDENGTVGFTCNIPLQQLAMGALEAGEAEAEVVEAEPIEAESAEEEAAQEESAEPKQIIPENVELAESMLPEIVDLGGEVELASADLGPAMQSLNTLFWKNKNHFYKQMSNTHEKTIYNAAKKAYIDQRKNGFTATVSSVVSAKELFKAISAVLDTYPYAFDYVNWGDTTKQGVVITDLYYRSTNRHTVGVRFKVSKYYSSSLEKEAKQQVNELVDQAYESACINYPNDITYGMVRFFDQWLCEHSFYEQAGTDGHSWNNATYYNCHVSYGTLLKGYGVCESYALAMTRLLDAAGIPNIYVTGDAGGGHAWNYVQMPNSNYYLQDSTWNDNTDKTHTTSFRTYLLAANDSTHTAWGQRWGYANSQGVFERPYNIFKFPSISTSKYNANSSDPITVTPSTAYIAKGKTTTLKLSGDGYYNKFQKSWESDKTSVAKVNQKGVVTAVAPGSATVTMTIGSKQINSKIYVFKWGNLSFHDKNKASISDTYTGTLERATNYYIDVGIQGDASAATVAQAKGLKVTTKSSNKNVATVSYTFTGNTILLTVTPHKLGDAKITAKFNGKTATLNLKVRQPIQANWFDLAFASKAYTGKALKPKVTKNDFAPDDVKFSTSYKSNKNAGNATVTITGKGLYGGEVTKSFTITPAEVTKEPKIGNAAAKTYNGAAQAAKVTLKLAGKTLKAGTDYEILYNGSTTVPTRAGSYTLTFRGKNYQGMLSDGGEHIYKINPVKAKNLKVTMKDSIKATGAAVSASTLNIKVKSGTKVLPASDYSVTYRNADNQTISAPSVKGTYKAVITLYSGNIDTAAKNEIIKTFKIVGGAD